MARTLLLCSWTAISFAASAQQSDTAERAVRLDQSIQALKDEVIELNREALAVENSTLVPDYLRVSVYLRVDVPGLLLQQVTVAIDDQTPTVYHYDEHDARALLKENALQRVMSTTVAPGPHRIRLSYTGQYAGAKDDAAPVTDRYEALFDKGDDEAELEFGLARTSLFGGNVQVRMKQWRAAR
ncbi:MAG: hypothetical protein PHP86_01760 [Nevskiales bacterium]|nr:hypothetical protein [Nevskiales bacterium]